VVAGALILPPVIDYEAEPWLREVTDSKCLSPGKREELAPLIERWALASAVAEATVEEIDRINIYHASHLAMCRAIEKLGSLPSHILVDGNRVPAALPCPATAIVKGDLKCLSIAAASILAKVWRDRAMTELDARYPGYGFAVHKGYATPAHSSALRALGPCEIHRRSFAPVALQLQSSLGF
jgi:ribonuclease HII